MSDTSGGFTLLDDRAAAELGLVRAAVLAAVLRHQRMRDGVCRASYEAIAEKLGLHRGTVLRNVKELLESGYILDLTPDCRHAPHAYRLTAKGWDLFEAQVGDQDALTEESSAATPNTPERSREESLSATPRGSTEQHQEYLSATEGYLSATRGTGKKHEENTIKERDVGALAPTPPPGPDPASGNGRRKPKARAPVPAAVKAYRAVTQLYPPRSWYSAMAQAVGNAEADLQRWREHVHQWVGRGWSPRNVQGMLDSWASGGIAPLPGRPDGRRPSPVEAERASVAALNEWLVDGDSAAPAFTMTDAEMYLEHALRGVD